MISMKSTIASTSILALLTGCAINDVGSMPPAGVGESFAKAVNDRDIEAVMGHWSEDALLFFLTGEEEPSVVTREEIRDNYEHMFAGDHAPRLTIRVEGTELLGEIAHEWGSFEFGESNGCYVIVRRKADDWKIYREWIVEPCGH